MFKILRKTIVLLLVLCFYVNSLPIQGSIRFNPQIILSNKISLSSQLSELSIKKNISKFITVLKSTNHSFREIYVDLLIKLFPYLYIFRDVLYGEGNTIDEQTFVTNYGLDQNPKYLHFIYKNQRANELLKIFADNEIEKSKLDLFFNIFFEESNKSQINISNLNKYMMQIDQKLKSLYVSKLDIFTEIFMDLSKQTNSKTALTNFLTIFSDDRLEVGKFVDLYNKEKSDVNKYLSLIFSSGEIKKENLETFFDILNGDSQLMHLEIIFKLLESNEGNKSIILNNFLTTFYTNDRIENFINNINNNTENNGISEFLSLFIKEDTSLIKNISLLLSRESQFIKENLQKLAVKNIKDSDIKELKILSEKYTKKFWEDKFYGNYPEVKNVKLSDNVFDFLYRELDKDIDFIVYDSSILKVNMENYEKSLKKKLNREEILEIIKLITIDSDILHKNFSNDEKINEYIDNLFLEQFKLKYSSLKDLAFLNDTKGVTLDNTLLILDSIYKTQIKPFEDKEKDSKLSEEEKRKVIDQKNVLIKKSDKIIEIALTLKDISITEGKKSEISKEDITKIQTLVNANNSSIDDIKIALSSLQSIFENGEAYNTYLKIITITLMAIYQPTIFSNIESVGYFSAGRNKDKPIWIKTGSANNNEKYVLKNVSSNVGEAKYIADLNKYIYEEYKKDKVNKIKVPELYEKENNKEENNNLLLSIPGKNYLLTEFLKEEDGAEFSFEKMHELDVKHQNNYPENHFYIKGSLAGKWHNEVKNFNPVNKAPEKHYFENGPILFYAKAMVNQYYSLNLPQKDLGNNKESIDQFLEKYSEKIENATIKKGDISRTDFNFMIDEYRKTINDYYNEKLLSGKKSHLHGDLNLGNVLFINQNDKIHPTELIDQEQNQYYYISDEFLRLILESFDNGGFANLDEEFTKDDIKLAILGFQKETDNALTRKDIRSIIEGFRYDILKQARTNIGSRQMFSNLMKTFNKYFGNETEINFFIQEVIEESLINNQIEISSEKSIVDNLKDSVLTLFEEDLSLSGLDKKEAKKFSYLPKLKSKFLYFENFFIKGNEKYVTFKGYESLLMSA